MARSRASVGYFAGYYNFGVAVGDVTGDGAPDIITTNDSSSSNLYVLPNHGDGTFGSAVVYTVASSPWDVALADVDGVTGLDIVTANFYGFGQSVTVLLNQGGGAFGPGASYDAGYYNSAVALDDINGDGAPDIVTTNYYDSMVSVLLNNNDGTGTFGSPAIFNVGGFSVRSVAAGDVNGDGAPDIVTGHEAGAVSVLLNDGGGSFGAAQTVDSVYGTFGVALGDLNEDGHLDIAAAGYYSSAVSVFLNVSSPPLLTLYAPDGTELISSATSTVGFDVLLTGFVASETGTYTLRVSSPAVPRSYSLFVTRDAVLDIEENDTIGTAQQLLAGRVGGALGAVQPVTDEDWYAVDVAADYVLRLTTSTPADGPGEFGNLLNPHIELYGPNGNLVATGTVLGDGRNERIEYLATIAGTYRVRVLSEDSTTGEYFMSATADAPLMATGVAVSGVRGQPLSGVVVATFTDADPDSMTTDFTVMINWGDGSPTELGTITPLGGGAFAVTGSHTYTDESDDGKKNHGKGAYTISVVILDMGGASASVQSKATISIAAIQDDPLNPGKKVLVIGGSTNDDRISIDRGRRSGTIEVTIDGKGKGHSDWTSTFSGSFSRIIVYGQAGDDDIEVADKISTSAWLYGGDGNDKLSGGSGPNVLLGGAGRDKLIGGSKRDLMIGGTGRDKVVGNAGDDILIGGTTSFDAWEAALYAIMSEWTSGRTYAARVANLGGTGSGPRLNGNYFLQASGPAQTVFDDGDKDTLTGSAGKDWFFANYQGGGVLDKITDFVTGETKNDL